MRAEEVRERRERRVGRSLLALVGEDRVGELFDDDVQRRRLDRNSMNFAQRREISRVAKGVVAHGEKAAAGRISTGEDLHELEVQRSDEDASVRSIARNTAQRDGVVGSVNPWEGVGLEGTLNAISPRRVEFHGEQRRVERDSRNREQRPVNLEGVEPCVPRLGRE